MTTTAHLDVLDRSVEKANVWINDVAAELQTSDRHEAYRALRAFLHVLRDRLPVPEAAQLAAQPAAPDPRHLLRRLAARTHPAALSRPG